MSQNTYCLLGNPNTGKTSLFNALTGSYEYVGNWSGVTVEKKVGTLRSKTGKLIDLPGIYDLNPISRDETVVTRFLLEEKFDCMLNIVDSSQIERNLNLTIQLLEFGAPVVMGLNMIDVAAGRGIHLNIQNLAKQLRIPILPVVARSGKGTDDILSTLSEKHVAPAIPLVLPYGEPAEKAITEIQALIKDMIPAKQSRWLAVQFLSKK